MVSSPSDEEKLQAIRRKAKRERIQQRQEEYRRKHAPDPPNDITEPETGPNRRIIIPAILIALIAWYAYSLTLAVVVFVVAFVITLAAVKKPPQQTSEDVEEVEVPAIAVRYEISVESNIRDADDVVEPYEEKDNFERFDYYRSVELPGIGNYKIKYVDQGGLHTERDIHIKRVHKDGDLYAVDAHCYLRDGHRSFIDDRIESAVNLDTGEVVDSVALDAIAQYKESDEGHAIAAIDREWSGVAILVFVCRADGRMLKPERAIVADYVKQRCPDIVLDDAALDDQIKAVEEPEQRAFRRMINSIKKSGDTENLTLLQDFAVRIVGTQKTVDPMEKAALEILGVK